MMGRPGQWALVTSLLLVACGTPSATRRHYAQTMDSATSACMRTPACYAATGEDAILPWLSRAASFARTTAAVMRLLEAADIERVETLLKECASEANGQVNEQRYGKGKWPTAEQCKEKVTTPSGQEETRAAELGRVKHEVALECARKKLEEAFPGNYSIEPRYFPDPRKGLRLISPSQVAEWLQDGLFHLLLGTLVPDIVIHATNEPLKVQAVYDFKFPCPLDNPPTWHRYDENHPFADMEQGEAYHSILGGMKPAMVVPGRIERI